MLRVDELPATVGVKNRNASLLEKSFLHTSVAERVMGGLPRGRCGDPLDERDLAGLNGLDDGGPPNSCDISRCTGDSVAVLLKEEGEGGSGMASGVWNGSWSSSQNGSVSSGTTVKSIRGPKDAQN